MNKKLYAERDIEEQGEYYFRHASAMTGEDLHSKSDIAAELAHRDIEIDTLRQQLHQAQTECYEALRRVAELEGYLHSRLMHPDYEYTTTDGPRKAWRDQDIPPDGIGWKANIHYGRDGWERFDYHEEAYWMRLRQQASELENNNE